MICAVLLLLGMSMSWAQTLDGVGPPSPPCHAFNTVSLEETDLSQLADVLWTSCLPKDRPFVIRPTGYYVYCGYHSKLFIDDVRASKGLWPHHIDYGRVGWIPASKDVLKEKDRDP